MYLVSLAWINLIFSSVVGVTLKYTGSHQLFWQKGDTAVWGCEHERRLFISFWMPKVSDTAWYQAALQTHFSPRGIKVMRVHWDKASKWFWFLQSPRIQGGWVRLNPRVTVTEKKTKRGKPFAFAWKPEREINKRHQELFIFFLQQVLHIEK